jgi:transmembrane sensor
MGISSAYDSEEIPWQLVADSFCDDLPEDERAQLDRWLAISASNREKYVQWQQRWQEGFANYNWYQEADAQAAWHSLSERIGVQETNVTRLSPVGRRVRWMAAAALLLVVLGGGWWYVNKGTETFYETAANEQKRVALPDGSSIILQPETALSVEANYNKRERRIRLDRGAAVFDVKHLAQLPFIVNMGATRILDIGTRFTIEKKEDQVEVSVQTGEVAFIKNSNGEEHDLSKGMALAFHTRKNSFGEVTRTGAAADSAGSDPSFRDAPLADILTYLETTYGRTIRVEDSSLLQQKITMRLAGESFEEALKIISISLNLKYTTEADLYILKK